MRNLVASVLATLFVAAPALAYDDEVGGGHAVVIQNRKFNLGNELTLSAGLLPIDAFYKGVTGTARYTLHLDEFVAWEVGSVTYSFNIPTDLQNQLRDNFAVQPQSFTEITGFAESALVIKPVYGKYAFLNRFLIYGELYFIAGGAVGLLNDFSFVPAPEYGAGMRFFLSKYLSVRADLRHYVFFNGVPVVDPNWRLENQLHLSVGASLTFGPALFPLLFGDDA